MLLVQAVSDATAHLVAVVDALLQLLGLARLDALSVPLSVALTPADGDADPLSLRDAAKLAENGALSVCSWLPLALSDADDDLVVLRDAAGDDEGEALALTLRDVVMDAVGSALRLLLGLLLGLVVADAEPLLLRVAVARGVSVDNKDTLPVLEPHALAPCVTLGVPHDDRV